MSGWELGIEFELQMKKKKIVFICKCKDRSTEQQQTVKHQNTFDVQIIQFH